MIEIEIHGEQRPAGSKRAFPFRKHDGSLGVRVSHDNPKSANWMRDVGFCASECYKGQPLEGPVRLEIEFERVRPKGHFGAKGVKASAPAFPIVKPDLTKLVRAVEDGLKGICWRDDSQVVQQNTIKRWGEKFRTVIRVFSVEV